MRALELLVRCYVAIILLVCCAVALVLVPLGVVAGWMELD